MAKKIELSDPKVREQIKDYILLMLGAPVVKIELDQSQLNLCVNDTCELMESSSKVDKWGDSSKLVYARLGSLAQAKLILGRIRSKYNRFNEPKGVKTKSKSASPELTLDGQVLLNEGEREYQVWFDKVFGV